MKAEILRKELEFSEDAKYYADKEYVTNSMLSLLNKSPQHLQMYLNLFLLLVHMYLQRKLL